MGLHNFNYRLHDTKGDPTMTFRYIVHPGYVRSKNDGDKHWIGFHEICRLYRVNPRECVNAGIPNYTNLGLRLTPLYPNENGDYSLPENEDKK